MLLIPAINKSSEWMFPELKRIKTYFRNLHGQARLNHLMVLHVFHNDTDQLDLTKVGLEFAGANTKRISISQCFYWTINSWKCFWKKVYKRSLQREKNVPKFHICIFCSSVFVQFRLVLFWNWTKHINLFSVIFFICQKVFY